MGRGSATGEDVRRAARRALRLLALFHLAALAIVGLLLVVGALSVAAMVQLSQHEYLDSLASGFTVIFAASVIAAVVVLASLVPRPDRLVAPGPELTARDAPELFEDLQLLVATFGMRTRLRVFLTHECSVRAADRGAWLGFGRQHVLSIGLPVFELLQRDQLRGVVASQMARMRNDDGMLASLAMRARAKMARASNDLRETSRYIGDDFERFPLVLQLARLPFDRFHDAYERASEPVADARAARAAAFASELVGADTMTAANWKLIDETDVYDSFHVEELKPLLARGLRPPIVEGFRRFRHSSQAEKIRQRSVLDPGEAGAIDLLVDIDALESRLAAHARRIAPTAVSWDALAERLWVPIWRQQLAQDRELLRGVKLATLERDTDRIRVRAAGHWVPSTVVDDRKLLRRWKELCGGTACLALLDAGWSVRAHPGESIVMSHGQLEWRVFAELDRYLGGWITIEEWEQRARELGLTELELPP